MAKKKAADVIAEKFIEKLERGTMPWIRPWELWTSWSRLTGNDYRGANILLLSGGEYVTMKQVNAEKGKVNKGAKSEQIVHYKEYEKDVTDQYETMDSFSKAKCRTAEDGRMMMRCKSLRYYNVFNVKDTDLEQKHEHKNVKHEWDACEKAEQIIKDYSEKYEVKIEHGSNKAYEVGGTRVVLPEREQFKDAPRYYSTAFHELIHSTAEKVSEKRDLSKYGSDKKIRAREELVAEIGAAYIMSYLGIETFLTDENSAAYAKSWAKNLKDDKSAILYAAPKAIEAAEMIIGKKNLI